MSNRKKINVSLASGFRDYLVEDMIPREEMIEIIRSVFKRFGFLPLETPALERENILTGGDFNFNKQIFRIASDKKSKERLALRFDLTVPLARVIAQYPNEILKPFKRYQFGYVWRGEKSQKGRYREFLQCDVDIVGARSVLADAEIISLAYETMTALGVRDFLIKINNRKILEGLSEVVGFNKKMTEKVLREIDKLDKENWRTVQKELKEKCSLSESQIKRIKAFIGIKNSNKTKQLNAAADFVKKSKLSLEGINELVEIAGFLKKLGVPEKNWEIDFSVARGLGYYTGPVFEVFLKKAVAFGSVCSGGRYDGLIGKFGSVQVPATGISIGMDRLYAAFVEMGIKKEKKDVPKVLVLSFDKTAEFYTVEITQLLRRNNISTEIYLGSEKNVKGQLAYALKKEIPIVIFAGGKEFKSKTAQVKNLKTKKQKEVKKSELAVFIKKECR